MIDVADVAGRMVSTGRERQLELYCPSPAFAAFMTDPSRRIMVRAANRAGKTKSGAAKLCREMLARPHRRYRAVAVTYSQSVGVIGRYLHEFLPSGELAPGCRFSLENGWTHQLVRLRNGTICEIRSQDQAAIAHAGSDLDGVLLDELPPSDILLESITRVMSRDGWVWVLATPIGRSTAYLRSMVEAEGSAWVQHVAEMSRENCPWYSAAQVDEWIEEARAFPDSFDQKIRGAWEGVTLARVFTGFDSTCLIQPDEPPPKGVTIGVGIDHGEHAGSQVAILIASNAEGVWILDECVSTTATTPTADARAIVEMLQRNGIEVHQVGRWVGDINSAGKAAAGYKINEILALAIAREAGHHNVSFTISAPMKGAGSVDIGEKLLNAGLLRRQVRVHPRCTVLINGLRHLRPGRKDEDLKHSIDACRYIVYDPLTTFNANRVSARRYQL